MTKKVWHLIHRRRAIIATPCVWGVVVSLMSASLLAGQWVLAQEPLQLAGGAMGGTEDAGVDGGGSHAMGKGALPQPSDVMDGSPSPSDAVSAAERDGTWAHRGAKDAGTAIDACEVPMTVSPSASVSQGPVAIPVPLLRPPPPVAGVYDHVIPGTRSHPLQVGVAADIGLSGPLPDAGLLLALRPIRWLQMQAGAGFNGFALGVRGGVTLINPLLIPLSLTGEAGHFFEGDANRVVRWFDSDVQAVGALRRFSYDYLNVLGGLEIGGRHFSFFVRGGVTWMRMTVRDFAQSVHDIARVDLQSSDPQVTYRGPSFKLGTQYLF